MSKNNNPTAKARLESKDEAKNRNEFCGEDNGNDVEMVEICRSQCKDQARLEAQNENLELKAETEPIVEVKAKEAVEDEDILGESDGSGFEIGQVGVAQVGEHSHPTNYVSIC